ncbi:MAG: hypothetical protein ABIX46_01585 [Burkholderiaceae bacterium]
MSTYRYLTVATAWCVSVAGATQAAGRDARDIAGDACETAVAQAVTEARGRAAREIRFVGSQRALSTTPGEATGVKGEGRYGGAAGASVPFTYTCAYDASSGATSGVMFSDKGAPEAPAVTTTADLARLSPEACEAATAAALKDKHPRVDAIRFGSDTRRLSPAGAARTALDGRGAVTRAPGMNAVAFNYRCEFDNRSGKVLRVSTTE